MAQEIINIGTVANDGTGDTVRAAFQKAKNNFTELYPLYMNNVNASVTGTTTETVLDEGCLIPGGTLEANDVLNIVVIHSKSGTAGTHTVRIRINATPVVAGSSMVGLSTGLSTTLWGPFIRSVAFKNSLSSQEVLNNAMNVATDFVNSTSAHTSLSVDFSVDQYIFPTITLANAGDTGTIRNWYIEVIRM